MRRLLFLGLAGVVGLGVAGAAAVAFLTREPDRDPGGPAPAPAPAGEAVAPSERPSSPEPAPVGLRYLALPAGAVERDLAAALSPCHGRFRTGPGQQPVLTLELEAEDGGGLVVVDARLASAGGASEGLVACLQELLPGRRLSGGSFPAGERFLVQFTARQEVEPPPQATPPPPSTALPTTSRRQVTRRPGSR